MAADALGLWLAVVGLGIYHGLNPAMGWPLAVANGLAARRARAVFATVLPLGAGHLLAMAVVLLPFALLARLVEWQSVLRAGAAALVLAFGLYRLIVRRHPRALARIAPTRLAWWSFLMATAHGAALMLLPIMLSLCRTDSGAAMAGEHAALATLMASGGAIAVAVALLHTLAMVVSGLLMAWLVYRWVGLKFLRRSWLNLDALWAASLIVAGVAGLWMALESEP
jgi:hypothetical protein